VEHRDVELLPQPREAKAGPELVTLGFGHRQIVQMTGQARGSRQVFERQAPGIEPQFRAQLAIRQPDVLVVLDERPDRSPLEVGADVTRKAPPDQMLRNHARPRPLRSAGSPDRRCTRKPRVLVGLSYLLRPGWRRQ
jgi:hypothetical protein